MNRVVLLLALALALPAQAQPITPKRMPVKARPVRIAQAVKKPAALPAVRPSAPTAGPAFRPDAKPGAKPVAKPDAKSWAKAATKTTKLPLLANEVPKPSANDPDRERIEKLQDELVSVVRGKVLGRLRVGMRVESLANGRVLFGWRSNALMDPASNQKVLATTAALLRLGSSFCYRTEVTGTPPDSAGVIAGDIVVRGSGDPSLRLRHIEALAESLTRAGVTRVTGAVLGDPRRIGTDEYLSTARAPLRVGGGTLEVRVRPSDRVGARPTVSIRPASDAFAVVNHAETRGKGRAKLTVDITRVGGRFQVTVGGKLPIARGEVVVHRTPPSHPLYAAVLLRQALTQAGVVVQGPAGIYSSEDRSLVSSSETLEGTLLASAQPSSDTPSPLGGRQPATAREILALHESEPLPLLLRRVNKDSDNEWAERVLETVGAEVLGGAPTTVKGLHVLRDSLTELGVSPLAYLPANGSGLGHQNRVTAAGMSELLRSLYFDPRVGPEMLQSLSVGGVDGTTRNRFRGTSAAHRVRAKTGTLSGVSCLSGLVGEGSDILTFSILVEGHRRFSVSAIRGAQVSAVNAMMRFARRASAEPAGDEGAAGTDFETGEELDDEETAPAEVQQ
jgi:serine-type D-Ala-D-Ala carboxypeptidase/endopeptidase (penicillin-binding protein 4)